MKTKIQRLTGPLMLFLAAMIWGCAFVAQSAAMDHIGPFTFNAVRSLLAVLFLLPLSLISQKKNRAAKITYRRRDQLMGGILCGLALAFASGTQQLSLSMGTTAGKAGFITAMYMLMVPVFSLFLGKKVRAILWPCIAVAVFGMYLLCVSDSTVAPGDLMALLCAVFYTFHILITDRYVQVADVITLSLTQFAVNMVVSGIIALTTETITLQPILDSWLPLVYTGVLSSGVAFTLQAAGQKRTDPTLASMLMSLESVFAVLGGFVILGDALSAREIIGCVLMFAAIIVPQLPGKKTNA